MTTRIAIAVLALAAAAPAAAQMESYTTQGKLAELRVGTYYWGEKVGNADLAGKVVLVQMAGL